jgi:DNA-binding GntR family transcriptional regulator
MMNLHLAEPSVRLDRSRQVAPQIEEILRQRILSLALKPNELLSRAALQAEFNVSLTPVRDALMKLGQEGLVDIYPQHATFVARIDLAAARQAHFLRMAIEIEAVRRIATGDAAVSVAAKLAPFLADQRRHAAPDESEAFSAADRGFHKVLYEAADIPDLWDVVRRQSGHIDRLRRLNLPLPGKIEAVLRDHESLVAAIERRDPEGAAAVMRRHLSGTLSIVDEIRQRYPDFLR